MVVYLQLLNEFRAPAAAGLNQVRVIANTPRLPKPRKSGGTPYPVAGVSTTLTFPARRGWTNSRCRILDPLPRTPGLTPK